MRRREFVVLFGAAAAWPLTARAQRLALPTIGYLNTGSRAQSQRLLRAFQEGLRDAGFVEGQNVAIEYRWADDQRDYIGAMARELANREVSVIAATGGSPSALAAKAATGTIPIVFAIGVDPVSIGLVPALNQPGGNITGATMLAVDLGSKRLELLCEVVPAANLVAAIVNPESAGAEILMKDLHVAGRTLGRRVEIIHAAAEQDFEPAFSALTKMHAPALLIGADPLFNSHSEKLAALCFRHAIPAIYQFAEFTAAGGLMSYGGSITETYRQAGTYAGRILSGDKPPDLPIQQVTKVELSINLKTAKALGITVPLPVLARADEVIE